MKTLISYLVTGDLMERFGEVQGIQERVFPLGGRGYDRLVVTDRMPRTREVDQMINLLPGASEFRFLERPDIQQWPEGLNISRARNYALSYAKEHGYEWLLLLDVDVVLLEEVDYPVGGFTQTWNFWSTEEEVRRGEFMMEDGGRWSGGSWFVLPREAFGLWFDEEFVGYYGQDQDYLHNVLIPGGIQPIGWRTKTMHIWHPRRVRYGNGTAQNCANMARLARRLAATLGPEFRKELKKWNNPELIGMVGMCVDNHETKGGTMKSIEVILDEGFAIGMIQSRKEAREFGVFVREVIQPRNILEVGTHCGGFLHVLDQVGQPGLRISVDMPWQEEDYKVANYRERAKHVQFVVGDAHKAETVARVRKVISDQSPAVSGLDLVFIDADHSYEGGRKHFECYRGLLRTGGYMGFHDCNNGWPCGDYVKKELWPKYQHWEFFEEKLYGISVVQVP